MFIFLTIWFTIDLNYNLYKARTNTKYSDQIEKDFINLMKVEKWNTYTGYNINSIAKQNCEEELFHRPSLTHKWYEKRRRDLVYLGAYSLLA